MRLRIADRQAVLSAEARVDAEFLKLPLPASDYVSSAWHLATVFDDAWRYVLSLATSSDSHPIEPGELAYRCLRKIDAAKYALRYGMERISRRQPFSGLNPPEMEIVPSAYQRAAHLLERGHDYLLASRAFGSYHAGNATAYQNYQGNLLVLKPDVRSNTFSALDQLVGGPRDGEIPILPLFKAFLGPETEDPLVASIGQTAQLQGQKVHYHFNPYLCNQLLASIPKPSSIVPASWVFPWGTSSDTHRLFEGLLARCLYHFFAIHFGANRLNVRGGGVSELCPVFSAHQLVCDLREITGLAPQAVSAILEALTYGIAADTPDPALQPLIRLSPQHLLAPSLLVVSSHYPRNLLSLHARVGTESFNRQSCLFENGMSERIELALKERFKQLRMHKDLPSRRAVGEVDVIVVDEASRTLLLGEMRWLLPPGDPREVNNRRRVCAEKVSQLAEKVSAAREVIPELLRSFNLESDPASWTVVGAVILEGYIAATPQSDTLPAVPLRVFESGLKHCNSLKQLHEWLRRQEWLPKKGTHFVESSLRRKFGSQQLEWGSFGLLLQNDYEEHLLKTLADSQEALASPPGC